jgi:hypothetical protein
MYLCIPSYASFVQILLNYITAATKSSVGTIYIRVSVGSLMVVRMYVLLITVGNALKALFNFNIGSIIMFLIK